MEDINEDVKAVIEKNLTDRDVRYKRILASLTPEQLKVCAAFFVQMSAYGTKPTNKAEIKRIDGNGGYAACAVRMAIMCAFGYDPRIVAALEMPK